MRRPEHSWWKRRPPFGKSPIQTFSKTAKIPTVGILLSCRETTAYTHYKAHIYRLLPASGYLKNPFINRIIPVRFRPEISSPPIIEQRIPTVGIRKQRLQPLRQFKEMMGLTTTNASENYAILKRPTGRPPNSHRGNSGRSICLTHAWNHVKQLQQTVLNNYCRHNNMQTDYNNNKWILVAAYK